MKIARYLPRFQQAYRSFTTLEDREGWTRERIADFQLQRLNEVWTHAIAHVPYYRDQRVELSLPPQFESLAEFSTTVPVLQKMELRTRSKEFLSEKPEPGKWYRTSGSTN
ncbi:MAG: hypothetical protein KDA45_10865, partial [Planctomycetales bacterium]|nr:hypothetical protein [Planctomycetales bacterium]